MTFEQALAAMRRGEKVRRPYYPENMGLGKCPDGISIFHGEVLKHKTRAIGNHDILAEDWEIVPAEVKQYCTKHHEFNVA